MRRTIPIDDRHAADFDFPEDILDFRIKANDYASCVFLVRANLGLRFTTHTLQLIDKWPVPDLKKKFSRLAQLSFRFIQ